MGTAPRTSFFMRRLSRGELPLGTSCACGLGVMLLWTAALGGLGVFLAPRSAGFLLETLGTWGSIGCFGLFLTAMSVSTCLVGKGIERSAKRFAGPPACALLARLFSFLMLPVLAYQVVFLFLEFFGVMLILLFILLLLVACVAL